MKAADSASREAALCRDLLRACGDEDVTRQAVVLQQLGEFFSTRARGCLRQDILSASAMYSIALTRTPSEENSFHILSKLDSLKHQLICIAKERFMTGKDQHTKCVVDECRESTARKLKKSRDVATKGVHCVNKIWNDMYISNDKKVLRGQELDILKEIQNLRLKIKLALKDIIKDVIHEFQEEVPPPSGSYAVVGLGDLANELTTPYCDVELAFIHEEDSTELSEYGHHLLSYIHHHMLYLSETPLTATGVNLVREPHHDKLHALFDYITPNGFKFNISSDSILSHYWNATQKGKTKFSVPLSKYLVLSPKALSKFHLQMIEQGNNAVMRKVMQNTLVFGKYVLLNECRESLDLNLHSKLRRDRVISTMLWDILPIYDFSYWDIYSQSDLKLDKLSEELVNFSGLLFILRLIYNIPTHNLYVTLDRLREKLLISRESHHDLKLALCICSFLQLSRHSFHRNQSGGCSLAHYLLEHNEHKLNPDIFSQIYGVENSSIIARFYSAALPLTFVLKQCPSRFEKLLISQTEFYQTDEALFAHVHARMLNYNEALSLFQNYMTRSSTCKDGLSAEDSTVVWTRCALLAMRMKDTKEANRYFCKAMESKEEISDQETKILCFVSTWHLMGVVHMMESKLDMAITYFNEAISMYDELMAGVQVQLQVEYGSFLASVNRSLAEVHLVKGHYKKSREFFQTSLTIGIDNHMPMSACANILHQLGILSLKMADFKQSMYFMKKCHNMFWKSCSQNSPSLCTASIMLTIGAVLDALGKPDSALAYKTHSYLSFRYILGTVHERNNSTELCDNGVTRELLGALTDMADCQMELTKFSSAHCVLSSCKRIFEGLSHIYTFWDMLTIETNLGDCLTHIGHSEQATKCFQKTKMILKTLLGKKDKNIHMATCLRSMGCVSVENKDDAVSSLSKSEEMFKSCAPLVFMQTLPRCEILRIKLVLVKVFQSKNKNDTVKNILSQAINLSKLVYGSHHQTTARLIHELAMTHHEAGDNIKSFEGLSESLEEYRQIYGKDNPNTDVANVLSDMAKVQMSLCNQNKVMRYLLDVVHTLWGRYGRHTPHEEIIAAHNRLGNFYREEKQFVLAVNEHKTMINLTRRLPSVSHVRFAEALAILGCDYMAAEFFADAAKTFEKAIETFRATMGENNFNMDVANWLGELGKAYQFLDREDKSDECHRMALEIKTRCLGKDTANTEILESLESLAINHERRKEYRKAVPLRRQALQQLQKLHGETPHPATAEALDALYELFTMLAEYQNALYYARWYSDMVDELNGFSDNKDMVVSLRKVGAAYVGMGLLPNGIKHLQNALDMLRRIYDEDTDQLDLASCQSELGHAQAAAGHLQTAIQNLLPAVAVIRKLHLKEAKQEPLAAAIYNLGWAYEAFPNFSQALSVHMEALEIRQKVHSQPNDKQLAYSMAAIGRCHCAMGNHDEGVPLLDKALSMQQIIYGDDNLRPDIINSTVELGNAYCDWTQATTGVKHLTKALQMMYKYYGHDKSSLQVARCLSYLAQVS